MLLKNGKQIGYGYMKTDIRASLWQII